MSEAPSTLRCSRCGDRPTSAFAVRTDRPRGYQSICKDCQRKQRKPQKKESTRRYHHSERLRRYGLTPEQFESMTSAQENACAICKGTTSTLCIDHDHSSGVVRGLLCSNCNTGIGLFKDDPTRLSNAIAYLEKGGA